MKLVVVLSAFFTLLGSTDLADEKHLDFVQALRERGYHDVAIEYLHSLAERDRVPEPVRALIDYELGKVLLLQATDERDLDKRDQQLEQSREHLRRFVDGHPNHGKAADAMTDLAMILVERGRVAVLQSNSPNKRSQRKEFQELGRKYFDDARTQFAEAEKKYQAEYKKFPSFIDPAAPKSKAQIDARTEALLSLIQSQLNLAIVEYENAQSFDRDSKEFRERLTAAIKKFDDVYTRYRGWLAGLYARMWTGKCYEEMGDIRKAVGFYEELRKHDDPNLAPLQKQVTYFHIICMNKRGDHVLAQETAERWINEHPRDARTKIGLGVRMELAAAMRDQAKKLPENDQQRARLLGQAVSIWNDVARYESEHKELALQEKGKWASVVGRRDRVLSFEEAFTLADRAREEEKWTEAIELYETALSQVTDKIDISQLNKVRYLYGFCLYQAKRYLPAAVILEHIATRYTDSGLALNAAYIALASYARSYETAKEAEQPEVDRTRLVRIADFLERRWPDTAEADFARLTLGTVALRLSDHVSAARAFERVSAKSDEYLSAQSRAAENYWNAYLSGLEVADVTQQAKELQSHLAKARELYTKTREDRIAKLDSMQPIPEDAVRADLFLAQIHLEGGQDLDALTLLEPLIKTVESRGDLASLHLTVLTSAMQAYVRAENLALAEEMMKKIEATGKDTAEITQLFQALAAQLKQKMDRLERLGDMSGAEQTRRSFLAFLDRLSKREAGQSFDSLSWIAASFFGLGAYDQAEQLFRTMLAKFADDPAVGADAKRKRTLTAVRLQLVTALRLQKKYADARQLMEQLHKENPKAIDVLMEYGRVLSWSGTESPAEFDTAVKHWKQYATYFGMMKPKPPQYYQSWLYLGLSRIGKAGATSRLASQELAQASREITLILGTMSEADRAAQLDESFGDALTLATLLGITEKPTSLGAFFELLLNKSGR
jgi:tetratricopeptide (TPR) repeat protein